MRLDVEREKVRGGGWSKGFWLEQCEKWVEYSGSQLALGILVSLGVQPTTVGSQLIEPTISWVQKSTDTGGWLYCAILYKGLEHPWYEAGSPGTSSSSIPRDDRWCVESCGKNRLRGENTISSYINFEYFSVEKVVLNIQMEMAYKQLNLRVYSLEKLELEIEVWEDTVKGWLF